MLKSVRKTGDGGKIGKIDFPKLARLATGSQFDVLMS